MINRFNAWKQWCEHNSSGRLYQLLVLFGITHSPTFEMYFKPAESSKYVNFKPKSLDEKYFILKPIKRETIISLIALVLSLIAFIFSLIIFLKLPVKAATNNTVENKQIIVDRKELRDEMIQLKQIMTKSRIEDEKIKHTYFDVPLTTDLQDHIFKVCEERDIDPAIIMAIIKRESNFRASTIGDGGDSLGLMQIQPKWHQYRADLLGCSDLMNPYNNITVGTDLFASLYKQSGSLEWALMAYNGGPSYATRKTRQGEISDYAKTVRSICELADFEIENRIVIRDRRTGKVYK